MLPGAVGVIEFRGQKNLVGGNHAGLPGTKLPEAVLPEIRSPGGKEEDFSTESLSRRVLQGCRTLNRFAPEIV